MKYYVTYGCGHEGTVSLIGKTSVRDRKIKWLETEGICPECQKKAQAEYTAKIESKYNLPELEGNQKQVAWAKDIRAQDISGYEACMQEMVDEALSMMNGKIEESRAYMTCVKRRGMTPEDAVAWINIAVKINTDHEFDRKVRAGEVKIPEDRMKELIEAGFMRGREACFYGKVWIIMRILTETSARWFIDRRVSDY